jgi:hypothetical protein
MSRQPVDGIQITGAWAEAPNVVMGNYIGLADEWSIG